MNARFVTLLIVLLGCSTFRPDISFAISMPGGPAPVEQTPAPGPSEAVLRILDEARHRTDVDQPLDSLKLADEAFDLGRQMDDLVGEALAREMRGDALERLQRVEEAVSAWQDASQLWARAGDTPRQIRALVRGALGCVPPEGENAERLLAQGLSSVRLENQDLGAVAQALHDSGLAIFDYTDKHHGLEQPATDYLRAALAIREKQTPRSRKLVETLNALAYVLVDQGLLNTDESFVCEARDYYARALEVGQRVAAGTSTVVESLRELGYCEYLLENYEAARDYYLEALRLQREIAPDGSLEEASILRHFGILEEDGFTQFAVAHQYLEEAIALGERMAPESALLEKSLENLGVLEDKEGDPSAARSLMERALAIKQKQPGNLAPTYINLGMVALDQYDFAAARFYLERALAIGQERFPDSMNVTFALGNLALMCYREGDLKAAFDYEKRALARLGDITEDQSLDATEDDVLMGEILRGQGKDDAAAEYFQRALDIREKLTPESLHVSDALVHLATLERTRGNHASAVEYDLRALQISRKACSNSWCASEILSDLGQLAYEKGDLAGAEAYLREAVEIREKALGLSHPDLARSLNRLALVLAVEGRRQEARQMALRAERIGAEHLRISVRTLSERQALAYEDIRASGLDLVLSLVAGGEDAARARTEAFDAVIRSRALVFDELAARHRGVHGSADAETAQLNETLLAARRRLATLVFRGVGESTPELYRRLLDDARDRKEMAERLLAEKSIAFREDFSRAQLGLDEVAGSLPPASALVAFVRYGRVDLQRPAAGKPPQAPILSYGAFVLGAGRREPSFVPLGPARLIEASLDVWRRNIARRAAAPEGFGDDEGDSRRLGAALRRRIWDPLVPHLGDATEVFVVPDAALHLVSLASLPSGRSQYVVETHLIHYLSTERDLVPSSSRQGEGILVVGNPAFDQTARSTMASNALVGSHDGAPLLATKQRGNRSSCGTFRTLRFSPLPASQREVEDIADLWRQSTAEVHTRGGETAAMPVGSGQLLEMTRENASPEAFEQSAPGRRVLHVATHGFFLEGTCDSAAQHRSANTQAKSPLPATAENPLLLSGLAFAGANRRAAVTPDESDGILTAEEIAGINLEGVDWAVLSACDTGVGEIKVGEGVFGLRRAFQVAGAKTIIMSLWPVEDETTRIWMGTLYREHFLHAKSTPEAVRAATLQALRERRARHLSTHPFYWAAFIAAGDWH